MTRRTLLVTAGLLLLAPAVGSRPQPAAAAEPKMTYGRGYTGGY